MDGKTGNRVRYPHEEVLEGQSIVDNYDILCQDGFRHGHDSRMDRAWSQQMPTEPWREMWAFCLFLI